MSKEQILLLIKRYSISIIRGYYEFKDVHVNLKPHVTRCLDNHGYGHKVDDDFREYYEKTYGSKKNEQAEEKEPEKETETSEEPEATESEETTEE
ncbi:hypothetical protein [Dolosigranulum savutiense]|uniref:Uncharacterized protein n=1 Tax=Dolosigranulum savutiense TaxID=3110288 RepID=A0AB74U743_9LACT